MRADFVTLLFFIFKTLHGQEENVTEEVLTLVKICDACTCSEIPDVDGTHLVLNVQCSELDSVDNLADLDKIAWPPNPNDLKISAAFEGLGLSTLGKLPPNSQVETLRFSNNAIKTYWPDPLSDVPNLKKLSFARNDLSEITPDLFTKIESLEELDLSYNRLWEFDPLVFKHLRQLKKLNLQSNQLKKIPVEALNPLSALEDLDLSKNGISDLVLQKSDTESLKGLKRLYLNGNRIRNILKDSFPKNNSLELLDLSNNIIERVDDAFLTCTNLRELNLAQNNITFVFAMPPLLQIAILKINTLYNWPKFPNTIKYIDLSYNRLSDLYDENSAIFNNLEVLNIGGNQIKEINIERKLPKLYILDVSYNLISDVPKTLSTQYYPNLEELHLDGNPIEAIYFKNILALKNLYMNDLNKLHVVGDKAFSNVVGRGDENGTNCFSLSLSNCQSLSEILDGAFDGTSLCMLDISKNNLTFISERLLDWRSLSEGVNLQWNPWHCSCDLQWIVDELIPRVYATPYAGLLDELKCGSPRGFAGLRLVHWYNWTDRALCTDVYARGGPHGTYVMQTSIEQSNWDKINKLTPILGGCIIIGLLIAIALTVYLVKTRKKYRIRRAALNRKRQSAIDALESNGTEKEHFSALNKA